MSDYSDLDSGDGITPPELVQPRPKRPKKARVAQSACVPGNGGAAQSVLPGDGDKGLPDACGKRVRYRKQGSAVGVSVAIKMEDASDPTGGTLDDAGATATTTARERAPEAGPAPLSGKKNEVAEVVPEFKNEDAELVPEFKVSEVKRLQGIVYYRKHARSFARRSAL